MAIQKKLYTVREFEQYADSHENQDRLLELIDGEIVEKMPTEEHGVIALNIGSPVKTHLKTNNLPGRVGVEIRHRNPTDQRNARIPDVSYRRVTDEPVVTKGSVPIMPDLAVEIASPGDQESVMRQKALFYLRNGSKLVWLAFAKRQVVEVCTLGGDGQLQIITLGKEDILDGGEVLPGFKLPVADVFEL